MRTTLARLPLPAAPVARLTALFELARFSDRPLGADARDAACDCLDEITSALDRRERPVPADRAPLAAWRLAARRSAAWCCSSPCRCTSTWSRRGGPSWRVWPRRSCSASRCSQLRRALARPARGPRRLGARRGTRPARARARRAAPLPGPGERRAHRAPQPALLRQGVVAAAGRARRRGRSSARRSGRGRGPSLASLREVIAAIEKQP